MNRTNTIRLKKFLVEFFGEFKWLIVINVFLMGLEFLPVTILFKACALAVMFIGIIVFALSEMKKIVDMEIERKHPGLLKRAQELRAIKKRASKRKFLWFGLFLVMTLSTAGCFKPYKSPNNQTVKKLDSLNKAFMAQLDRSNLEYEMAKECKKRGDSVGFNLHLDSAEFYQKKSQRTDTMQYLTRETL